MKCRKISNSIVNYFITTQIITKLSKKSIMMPVEQQYHEVGDFVQTQYDFSSYSAVVSQGHYV